jgi:hypothetical protein
MSLERYEMLIESAQRLPDQACKSVTITGGPGGRVTVNTPSGRYAIDLGNTTPPLRVANLNEIVVNVVTPTWITIVAT